MPALGWTLLSAAAALAFGILYGLELLRGRKLRRDLSYMTDKLARYADKDTLPGRERLLVVTGEPELRRLLTGINDLIDRAAGLAADYARSGQSMRRMLSNVSHDLKTPLTVILGYAEVLERSPDLSEDERRAMLAQVYRKTLEVHERINAFFDLSKLEADDYNLPLSVIDAAEVCRHRILGYFDLLTERGFEVEIALPEHPVWIYANEEALSRILDNLLSNAVRYGADGRFLGLRLRASAEQVVIEVADRGRGIPAAEQANVFERMYTLEDSRSRNLQGSGIGLAIVKRLTERLGGSVTLESEPARSTVFALAFPASPYRPEQPK
ncbi:HAMP domain-containing sensor histidine kinase [Saccharibacillus sp. CPCC 101409]|uniref:sensor histidine kinase n=1 Tax=Saccharibacillus sp. CPCC 101409 TaxID=3058041 RepID=UPI0026736D17|nr:HAMP domain-containing sensor histidine kinase [Saccharibacillus sp. CPCC 101409]MDO3409827.1 HAMP domain-containing sensor histidine kinase [Saccharibacillus sp. CPCC 101409]